LHPRRVYYLSLVSLDPNSAKARKQVEISREAFTYRNNYLFLIP
jgi:hypothetical protein